MYIWKCSFCGKQLMNNVINKTNGSVHFVCEICKESFDVPLSKLKNKAIK